MAIGEDLWEFVLKSTSIGTAICILCIQDEYERLCVTRDVDWHLDRSIGAIKMSSICDLLPLCSPFLSYLQVHRDITSSRDLK